MKEKHYSIVKKIALIVARKLMMEVLIIPYFSSSMLGCPFFSASCTISLCMEEATLLQLIEFVYELLHLKNIVDLCGILYSI